MTLIRLLAAIIVTTLLIGLASVFVPASKPGTSEAAPCRLPFPCFSQYR